MRDCCKYLNWQVGCVAKLLAVKPAVTQTPVVVQFEQDIDENDVSGQGG